MNMHNKCGIYSKRRKLSTVFTDTVESFFRKNGRGKPEELSDKSSGLFVITVYL